jgi:hypothetical protein
MIDLAILSLHSSEWFLDVLEFEFAAAQPGHPQVMP